MNHKVPLTEFNSKKPYLLRLAISTLNGIGNIFSPDLPYHVQDSTQKKTNLPLWIALANGTYRQPIEIHTGLTLQKILLAKP
jgi:hypothetical protein